MSDHLQLEFTLDHFNIGMINLFDITEKRKLSFYLHLFMLTTVGWGFIPLLKLKICNMGIKTNVNSYRLPYLVLGFKLHQNIQFP